MGTASGRCRETVVDNEDGNCVGEMSREVTPKDTSSTCDDDLIAQLASQASPADAYFAFLAQARVEDPVQILPQADYDEYVIHLVNANDIVLMLVDRYSGFRTLHQELQKSHPNHKLPAFPESKWSHVRTPEVTSQRAVDFQRYWNELLDLARDLPSLRHELNELLSNKWRACCEDFDDSHELKPGSLVGVTCATREALDAAIANMGPGDIAFEFRRFTPCATFSGWAGDRRGFVDDKFGESSRVALTILIKNWEHALNAAMGDDYQLLYHAWTSGTHVASTAAQALRFARQHLPGLSVGYLDEAKVAMRVKTYEVPASHGSENGGPTALRYKLSFRAGNPHLPVDVRVRTSVELSIQRATGGGPLVQGRVRGSRFPNMEALIRVGDLSAAADVNVESGDVSAAELCKHGHAQAEYKSEQDVRIHAKILSLSRYDYSSSGYKPFYQFPGVYLMERTTNLCDFEYVHGISLTRGTFSKCLSWERHEEVLSLDTSS